MLHVLFSVYLKMLVLYSPFFVLSCFISLTRGYSSKERRRLAWKVALATRFLGVVFMVIRTSRLQAEPESERDQMWELACLRWRCVR